MAAPASGLLGEEIMEHALSKEVYWLALALFMTAIMWVPYIVTTS